MIAAVYYIGFNMDDAVVGSKAGERSKKLRQAMSLAVNGFVNDLVRQFPMEYSVELKRLIDLEMEGSVG